MFDETLKTALTVALNQSPFVNVLSDEKVSATMKLMTLPSGTKLTAEQARELCQRADGKAYISGSIANLGNEYVLGLKAINCQSGDALAQSQVTANSKESVLTAVGDAATRLREALGESLDTVQKFAVPLEQAPHSWRTCTRYTFEEKCIWVKRREPKHWLSSRRSLIGAAL